MGRLFPFRSEASADAEEPKLVDISEEAADEVFAALSSGTARQAYTALHEEPRTASDLAEVTDTTVQNVRYHLDNLDDAGLIEVVDTWYSERGTEMKVYAPTDTSLVVFAGDDDDRASLRTVLRELVGGVGVLAIAALLVQRVAERGLPVPSSSGGAPAYDGGNASGATSTPTTETATETISRTTESAETTVLQTTTEAVAQTTTATAGSGGLDLPVAGLAFFAVGFVVLVALLAWRHAR